MNDMFRKLVDIAMTRLSRMEKFAQVSIKEGLGDMVIRYWMLYSKNMVNRTIRKYLTHRTQKT